MIQKGTLSGHPHGSYVEGWMLLVDVSIRQAATGSSYLRWNGFDINAQKVTGTFFVNGDFPSFEKGQVIAVTGTIGQSKNSGLDVWAKTMIAVTNENDVNDFKDLCYPSVPKDKLDFIIGQLDAYSKGFSTIELQKLSEKMFEFMKPFLRKIPAGKSVHDALRGGLAKHTYEVLCILNNKLLLDKNLNMEVLLFSALYHDIGKCNSYTGDIQMTSEGMLVPHLADSLKIMTKIICENNINLNAKLRMEIEHCILSHHGKEFSPAKPCTREALALHYADNMVSHIAHIDGYIINKEVGVDGWSLYSNVLESRAYVSYLDDSNGK